jgi:hypothetical protein
MNASASPVPERSSDESGASKRTTFRAVFRAVRWVVYVTAIVTLVMMFHAVRPPAIATSAQASARVDEKLQEVEHAVAAGQSATLRLDQTELNSYLASHLEIAPSEAPRGGALQGAAPRGNDGGASEIPVPTGSTAEPLEQVRSTVRDVKVELIEDRARAYVVFDFHGKDMTLQLEGRLAAANGYLHFEPVSGQIGSLPIPQSTLQTAVQKMMESPENREKLKLPAEIADLRIENGELLATFR